MSKNRFLTALIWELKSLFRFPFPEVLIGLFTYLIFLPSQRYGFSFTVSPENLSWESITRSIAFQSVSRAALSSPSAYIPISIFASIFATLIFAYEIENGLLKVHLSHPISKRNVFSAKLLSCFLIVFTTFSVSLLSFTFLQFPENDLYLILSSDLILKVLLIAMFQSLFVISVAVSFSLYSANTSISLIGSFATLYLIQLLGESTNLEFLPPTSLRQQALYILSMPTPNLSQLPNFLATPLISVFLIILSYLYFSRRLQIS